MNARLAALGLTAATAISCSVMAAAAEKYDTILVPERAIVLTGSPQNAKELLGIFYSREDVPFNEPSAPRFLLLDREGTVAFGIGGSLYATASYDFKGSINSNNFTTYDIPVPADPGQRSRFGADLSHSSIFMRLVGKSTRFGYYQVYMQSNFSGNDGHYGFKLKQAYVSLGHLTAGLTNSTFVDPASQAPTVDPEGPSGQVAGKNILFRYTSCNFGGFKAAISAEVPSASYTTGAACEAIAQRMPDIPLYVQYGWGKSSHLRLSAIFRDLSYRSLTEGENHFKAAGGAQLSLFTDVAPEGTVQLFGHFAIGKGIARYINDLADTGYDLVYDGQGGLTAPKMTGWTAGCYVYARPNLFFTGSFSRSQLYDTAYLGASTYKYGQYLALNGFYDVDANFRVGAEYLRGWRKNTDGASDTANRINLLLQYSF